MTANAKQVTLIEDISTIGNLEFSPDGQTLVSGSNDNIVRIWDAATGTELKTFTGHKDYISAISFAPDGRTIASASGDQTIRFWDRALGTEKSLIIG